MFLTFLLLSDPLLLKIETGVGVDGRVEGLDDEAFGLE